MLNLTPSGSTIRAAGNRWSKRYAWIERTRTFLRRKIIRNIGIALFALSFLCPPRWQGGDDFHLFGGLSAFIMTPEIAFHEIHADRDEASEHPALLFVIMMAAWVANLTVFTRLPRVATLIAILLPWPAYIYLFSVLAGFIPFYPWALGIALIHLSRFRKPLAQLPNTERADADLRQFHLRQLLQPGPARLAALLLLMLLIFMALVRLRSG